jgi:hypothetical protein
MHKTGCAVLVNDDRGSIEQDKANQNYPHRET